MEKCFVITRNPVNAHYAVRSHAGKPKLVAFKSKQNAKYMLRLLSNQNNKKDETQNKTFDKIKKDVCELLHKPKCNLVLEEVNTTILIRRCAMNCLDLILFDEEGNYTDIKLDVSQEDYVFHLENTIRYF